MEITREMAMGQVALAREQVNSGNRLTAACATGFLNYLGKNRNLGERLVAAKNPMMSVTGPLLVVCWAMIDAGELKI